MIVRRWLHVVVTGPIIIRSAVVIIRRAVEIVGRRSSRINVDRRAPGVGGPAHVEINTLRYAIFWTEPAARAENAGLGKLIGGQGRCLDGVKIRAKIMKS